MPVPHIAHITIKNYRNFKELDIDSDEKQLVIGENSSGKSNYIRAIRLILDPAMSDQDRVLSEEDFSNTIINPTETGEEIEISIYIDNFKDNSALMCIIGDAIVTLDDRKLAKITYKYGPIDKTSPEKGYQYIIFKGNDVRNKFDSFCRKYLNVKVIHALRDVDSDLMSSRRSPLYAILSKYKIDLEDDCYKDIVDSIQTENSKLLEIDEIADVRVSVKKRIDGILNRYNNSQIDMGLTEVNPNKLLSLLRIYENGKTLSDTSLGICNVIYIQLVLQQIQTQTIPTYISKLNFNNMANGEKVIIKKYYSKTARDNFIRNKDIISSEDQIIINNALSKIDDTRNSTTILLIEEPEAHLHPSFQRMIYKDVFVNSYSSIIMTTHSPHLASICPIEYVVNFRKNSENLTDSTSAFNVNLTGHEKKNLQRYIDVNRGEIFFGKGIILVEGISEEMLIPVFADKMSKNLDSKGIVICNINSTNFLPYIRLLDELDMPYVVITDGDPDCDVTGEKRMKDLCIKLYLEEVIDGVTSWKRFFSTEGYFIGESTLEIDIMKAFQSNGETASIIEAFIFATIGGETQKRNFKTNYREKDFNACLRAIESKNVGKGRFAQELALSDFKIDSIPEYIKNAINRIHELV